MEIPRTHAPGKIVSGRQIAKTRILVADEHPLLRHGIVTFISGQPDMIVCGEADCISSIRTKIAETRPHLLVIGYGWAPATVWNLSKGSKRKTQGC